LIKVTF